jgi:hypothetical protein
MIIPVLEPKLQKFPVIVGDRFADDCFHRHGLSIWYCSILLKAYWGGPLEGTPLGAGTRLYRLNPMGSCGQRRA